jgi:hypothetical protein
MVSLKMQISSLIELEITPTGFKTSTSFMQLLLKQLTFYNQLYKVKITQVD